MTHRIRMARKRLMVARERLQRTSKTLLSTDIYPLWKDPAWHRVNRRYKTLRAIERRKDRIA